MNCYAVPDKFRQINYSAGMKTKHTLKMCFQKEFSIMTSLAKEKVIFEVPELSLRLESEPIKGWKIGDRVFKQYSCLSYTFCAQCCLHKFWKIFTYQPVGDSRPVKTFVNGVEKIFFCQDDNYRGRCQYLTASNSCTIHSKNPLHCALPLLSFDRRKGSDIVLIRKRLYGRNFNVGCPVSFSDYTHYKDFEQDTLSRLYRLRDHMLLLGIPSYADDVIAEVTAKGRKLIPN